MDGTVFMILVLVFDFSAMKGMKFRISCLWLTLQNVGLVDLNVICIGWAILEIVECRAQHARIKELLH